MGRWRSQSIGWISALVLFVLGAGAIAQQRDPPPTKQLGMMRTGLFAAVSKGDIKAVERLLDKGSDPNEFGADGERPLGRAVVNGHLSVAELLIERGASIDEQDSFGLSPLMDAANNNRLKMAEMLLEHGADVNRRSSAGRSFVPGQTALHVAAMRGDKRIVELFLKSGASTNAKDGQGHTPLALARNDPKLRKILLNAGARK